MKNKHTPGPWKYFNGSNPELVDFTLVPPERDTVSGLGWKSKTICISNASDEILAEVKAFDTALYLRDFIQWEANCKLILAAPDLLDAIEVLRAAFVVAVGDKSPFAKEALKMANSAIEKATS